MFGRCRIPVSPNGSRPSPGLRGAGTGNSSWPRLCVVRVAWATCLVPMGCGSEGTVCAAGGGSPVPAQQLLLLRPAPVPVAVWVCCSGEAGFGCWAASCAQTAGKHPGKTATGDTQPWHLAAPCCPPQSPSLSSFSSKWRPDHHPGRKRLWAGPERVHGGPWHRQRADGGCPCAVSLGSWEQGCVLCLRVFRA